MTEVTYVEYEYGCTPGSASAGLSRHRLQRRGLSGRAWVSRGIWYGIVSLISDWRQDGRDVHGCALGEVELTKSSEVFDGHKLEFLGVSWLRVCCIDKRG
jgi:hypothetical protein